MKNTKIDFDKNQRARELYDKWCFCEHTFYYWFNKMAGYIKKKPRLKKIGFIGRPRLRILRHMISIDEQIAMLSRAKPQEPIATPAPKIPPELLANTLHPVQLKYREEMLLSGYVENIPASFRIWIDEKYGKGLFIEHIMFYVYAVYFSDRYRRLHQDVLPMDLTTIRFVDNLETFLKLSKLGNDLFSSHYHDNDCKLILDNINEYKIYNE